MVINQSILATARAIAADPFKFIHQKGARPVTIPTATPQEDEALDFLEGPDPEGPSLAELAELAAKPKSKRTFYCHKLTGPAKNKHENCGDDEGNPVIATVRATTLAEAAHLFNSQDATVKYLEV